jgi:5-hydroxyisourate hydrolase-like protein (transthyretin family)
LAFAFDLKTLNVDVAIFVFDYFGQPLSNAEVRIERQTGQGLVLVSTEATSSDGSARFASILGGDFHVSVYIGGQLVGVKTQFLGAGSEDMEFVVGEYVNLLGFPILTGAFVLIVFLIVILVVALILVRRRILNVFKKLARR